MTIIVLPINPTRNPDKVCKINPYLLIKTSLRQKILREAFFREMCTDFLVLEQNNRHCHDRY
jgi:hypothetical protein